MADYEISLSAVEFEAEVERLRASDGLYYRAEDVEALPERERRRHGASIEAAKRDGRMLSGPPSRWTPGQRRAYEGQLVARGGQRYSQAQLEDEMSFADRQFRDPEITASIRRGDFVPRDGRAFLGRDGRRTIAQIERDRHPEPRPRPLVYEADLAAMTHREREDLYREAEIVPSRVPRQEFELRRRAREMWEG